MERHRVRSAARRRDAGRRLRPPVAAGGSVFRDRPAAHRCAHHPRRPQRQDQPAAAGAHCAGIAGPRLASSPARSPRRCRRPSPQHRGARRVGRADLRTARHHRTARLTAVRPGPAGLASPARRMCGRPGLPARFRRAAGECLGRCPHRGRWPQGRCRPGDRRRLCLRGGGASRRAWAGAAAPGSTLSGWRGHHPAVEGRTVHPGDSGARQRRWPAGGGRGRSLRAVGAGGSAGHPALRGRGPRDPGRRRPPRHPGDHPPPPTRADRRHGPGHAERHAGRRGLPHGPARPALQAADPDLGSV